jgi:hypothetical protein
VVYDKIAPDTIGRIVRIDQSSGTIVVGPSARILATRSRSDREILSEVKLN